MRHQEQQGYFANAPEPKNPLERRARAALWVVVAVLILLGGTFAAVQFRSGFRQSAVPPDRADPAVKSPTSLPLRPPVVSDVPKIPFVEITSAAGIDFVHENGASAEKLMPESMGGGGGFLDFDSDGDQDIVLVNSMRWPWDSSTAATSNGSTGLRLYQNDGRGNFTDVTREWGLNITCYGMGCACGDFDNDGDADLYVTAVGSNRLFQNDGNRFVEITSSAGVAGDPDAFSTSAGWFDYDVDGDLDLFVCNYIDWSRANDLAKHFRLPSGEPAYGRPQDFDGAHPDLFRNEGNGRFTDVAEQVGLHLIDQANGTPKAKSLGVTFVDLNDDGLLEIVISNDTVQNFLFQNSPDNTFTDRGWLTGIAFDPAGQTRGAMGVDAIRYRKNPVDAVAIGNFANEMTAFYVSNAGAMQFTDEALHNGLGHRTQQELTFGVFLFDADLDGRPDLFAANGHLEPQIQRVQPSQHYRQPPQLFWNAGRDASHEFVPLTSQSVGDDLTRPSVGRGAAYADIDADGDLDILLMAAGQPVRLLRNDQQVSHHWIRLKLTGSDSNADAIGARVIVTTSQGRQFRQVMPTRSYLSQVELPVTFGLGTADTVSQVEVRWPSGKSSIHKNLEVDRLHEIVEPATEASAEPEESITTEP